MAKTNKVLYFPHGQGPRHKGNRLEYAAVQIDPQRHGRAGVLVALVSVMPLQLELIPNSHEVNLNEGFIRVS